MRRTDTSELVLMPSFAGIGRMRMKKRYVILSAAAGVIGVGFIAFGIRSRVMENKAAVSMSVIGWAVIFRVFDCLTHSSVIKGDNHKNAK